jgi:hypothetical protein
MNESRMHKWKNIKQRSNDKGHSSYWILVDLYIGLLVWIKIWKITLHWVDQTRSTKKEVEVSVRSVKPKWRGYKVSWTSLTILMLIHVCLYVSQTRAGLISTFISRRYSSKDDNIEEMVFQWMLNMMWLEYGLIGWR